jgi:hypothetical protein
MFPTKYYLIVYTPPVVVTISYFYQVLVLGLLFFSSLPGTGRVLSITGVVLYLPGTRSTVVYFYQVL